MSGSIPNGLTAIKGILHSKARFKVEKINKKMNIKDYKKIFSYLEDDKFLIVFPTNKLTAKKDKRYNRICQKIENLTSSSYLFANYNVNDKAKVKVLNLANKGLHNCLLIRISVFKEILNGEDFKLYDLSRNESIYIKSFSTINDEAKSNGFDMKMLRELCKNKKDKKRKCKGIESFGNTNISPNLEKWIKQKEYQLTKSPTKCELWLYSRLSKAFKGRVKFQHPFVINGKPYFADIVIKSKRLIIEVDGKYHNKTKVKNHDFLRDEDFKSIGYETIRIKNEDINRKSIQELIDKIKNK